MNQKIKTNIGHSESVFIEVKEIDVKDIPDEIKAAFEKAESEGYITEGCPAVILPDEKLMEDIRRRR